MEIAKTDELICEWHAITDDVIELKNCFLGKASDDYAIKIAIENMG